MVVWLCVFVYVYSSCCHTHNNRGLKEKRSLVKTVSKQASTCISGHVYSSTYCKYVDLFHVSRGDCDRDVNQVQLECGHIVLRANQAKVETPVWVYHGRCGSLL